MAMRLRWFLLPAAALVVAFPACTNTGGTTASNPGGTGPFDSRGNYVEAWADSPSKWKEGSRQVVNAEPELPPATDIPVSPPPVLAMNETPKPVSSTTTVVYKKTPTRSSAGSASSSVASNSSRPKAKTTSSSSKPVVVKPKSTSKSKTVVSTKPKPKAKAAARHTVRSGDNLYSIAKRYGTSVGALQKANGVKGAMIKPGQTLTIPK
ncbi:LysM peptidoglycan-binding domain-containing protein [Luteolibacter luteus]|nr:LysM peptidoglycan-binding domain-containing protein [Luteolibacter luteus]